MPWVKVVCTLSAERSYWSFLFAIPDDDCLLFTACPADTYGLGCGFTCTCQNGAGCRSTDGACNCTSGYTGLDCSHSKCHTHTHAGRHALRNLNFSCFSAVAIQNWILFYSGQVGILWHHDKINWSGGLVNCDVMTRNKLSY